MRLILLLLLFIGSAAFSPTVQTARHRASFLSASTSYQLSPEPPGGSVMEAEADLKGSKMKDMGDGTFWLQYKADGGEVSKLRTQILKDASKKAQFPGFRKGQIPPYAMPQMTSFALQEAITNSLEVVVAAYGLKTLSGSEGNIDVKEKVEDIARGWKEGDVEYTATFKGEFVPQEDK